MVGKGVSITRRLILFFYLLFDYSTTFCILSVFSINNGLWNLILVLFHTHYFVEECIEKQFCYTESGIVFFEGFLWIYMWGFFTFTAMNPIKWPCLSGGKILCSISFAKHKWELEKCWQVYIAIPFFFEREQEICAAIVRNNCSDN